MKLSKSDFSRLKPTLELKERLSRVFKGTIFTFSLIGLLSVLNLVYLRPWSHPNLSGQISDIITSEEHSPLMISAAKIIQGSVPQAGITRQDDPIPVGLR